MSGGTPVHLYNFFQGIKLPQEVLKNFTCGWITKILDLCREKILLNSFFLLLNPSHLLPSFTDVIYNISEFWSFLQMQDFIFHVSKSKIKWTMWITFEGIQERNPPWKSLYAVSTAFLSILVTLEAVQNLYFLSTWCQELYVEFPPCINWSQHTALSWSRMLTGFGLKWKLGFYEASF